MNNGLRSEFYCFVVYDIKELRVSKIYKITKKYLNPVQNSFFEGHLLISEYKLLLSELSKIIVPEEDKYSFIILKNEKDFIKNELGIKSDDNDLFF